MHRAAITVRGKNGEPKFPLGFCGNDQRRRLLRELDVEKAIGLRADELSIRGHVGHCNAECFLAPHDIREARQHDKMWC